MNCTDNQAIVFGNDHTNSLGVVQALGREGVSVTAVLWGSETGVVQSSKYTTKIYRGKNAQECIDIIINNCKEGMTSVILPCTDEAAVILENNKSRLDGFAFQSCRNYSLVQLEDKAEQTEIAKKSGLNVPVSMIVHNKSEVPDDFPFPCLIKPVLSTEGTTKDIQVCQNRDELNEKLEMILPRTERILLQQYIDKKSDCGVVGCRLKDGTVIIPGIIDRPRIYPPQTGLGTIYVLDRLNDEHLIRGIKKYVEIIDFVGLFSVEFAISKSDGHYYFIEANFRNDGENPCLVKVGINIMYVHYLDMLDLQTPAIGDVKHLETISEIRHLESMRYGHITKWQWLKDIILSDTFMTYYKDDKKPFRKLVFDNYIISRGLCRVKKLFGRG